MWQINALYALAAGFLAFFAGCLISIMPVYLLYLSGLGFANFQKISTGTEESKFIRGKVFLNSLFFIFGFSLIFIILGATASALGQLLLEKRFILEKIGAIFIILIGANFLGLLKISFLNKTLGFKEKKFSKFHLINSFILGAVFALTWTPCFSPILTSILFLASLSETMWQGIYLLILFSLGLSIPFLILGMALNFSLKLILKIKPHLEKIKIFTGLLMVIIGILIFLGKWGEFINIFR